MSATTDEIKAPREEWITVCEHCGHCDRDELRATVGTGCFACGGYGCLSSRLAVVVDTPVVPSDTYVWSPYLSRRSTV